MYFPVERSPSFPHTLGSRLHLAYRKALADSFIFIFHLAFFDFVSFSLLFIFFISVYLFPSFLILNLACLMARAEARCLRKFFRPSLLAWVHCHVPQATNFIVVFLKVSFAFAFAFAVAVWVVSSHPSTWVSVYLPLEVNLLLSQVNVVLRPTLLTAAQTLISNLLDSLQTTIRWLAPSTSKLAAPFVINWFPY